MKRIFALVLVLLMLSFFQNLKEGWAWPFGPTTSGSSITSYSDVVSLFGSGSCSGYLRSDGTCDTPGGSLGGGTQYYLPVWTGGTTLGKLASLGSAGNPLVSSGASANPLWLAIVLAGGTNTFSITNGTASLDVAAGATLNIDTSLTVDTAAVTLKGKSGGSTLTLPPSLSLDGTFTNGYLCTYTSSGTVINCNTATTTFQTADADLTTWAGITPSANMQTWLASADLNAMKEGLSVDDLVTLSGVADGATHLGTFTGSTINDSQTVKQALQSLETAIEGKTTIGDGASDVKVYLYKNNTDTHWSGNAIILTAHENVAIGQLVFINSDGEAALAKANATATLPAIGIVVVAGNADGPCTVLTHGTLTNDAWTFTAGNIIHVSAGTAGLATATAPSTSTNLVQRVGVALSDDTILFLGGLTVVEVP